MLFYRFFLSLLLVSFIPVAANVYQLWLSQETSKNSVDSALVSSANLVVNQVDNWVELNLKSSELIAKTEEIQSMIDVRQVPLLQATDETFEWSYAAFTTDLAGQAIARSDGKPLKFYGDREYIKSIVEEGEDVGQQVLISRVNGKPALCLSIPVKRSDVLTGTLVQCSSLVAISEAVASTKIGETGLARLTDHKQRLIAHGDVNELTEDLRDLSSDPVAQLGENEQPSIIMLNGKKVVVYSLQTKLGWYLSVIQDYEDAYASLNQSKRNALITLALLIVGVILTAYFLGNNISKPIRDLAQVATTFSKGEIRQDIPGVNRKDEIGELAQSIRRLGQGIQVMVKRYTTIKNNQE